MHRFLNKILSLMQLPRMGVFSSKERCISLENTKLQSLDRGNRSKFKVNSPQNFIKIEYAGPFCELNVCPWVRLMNNPLESE